MAGGYWFRPIVIILAPIWAVAANLVVWCTERIGGDRWDILAWRQRFDATIKMAFPPRFSLIPQGVLATLDEVASGMVDRRRTASFLEHRAARIDGLQPPLGLRLTA